MKMFRIPEILNHHHASRSHGDGVNKAAFPVVTPISDIWWVVRVQDEAVRQQDSQRKRSSILPQPIGHPKHLSNRSFCSRSLAGEKTRGHSKTQKIPQPLIKQKLVQPLQNIHSLCC